ncbi:MAG: FtsW/RodA/SpoVE family cell cycle protein [Lachnospiraceae bacterium]|nr:FtsW/RodA/SpoVE family cell cycle protein [Lachnospiraceae bacterium]
MKDKIKGLFVEYNFRKYDFWLVLLTLAICSLGVIFVGSAEASHMKNQRMGVILGAVIMLIISFISYNFIIKFYWLIYIGCIGSLVLVRLFGDTGGGAARWLEFGSFRFQPSELVKILLILFYAQFIMKREDNINTIRVIVACVVLVLPVVYLIFEQPDLSTSIMVMVIFCSVMFIGGISLKIVIGAVVVAVPTVMLAISYLIKDGVDVLNTYQKNRILAWLYPEQFVDTEAYQTLNAITAIGSGQLSGKGLDNNVIASVKNGNFISEAHTDMIFAVVGEETGFIGGCVVIGLLLLIVIECIRVAISAKDLAGSIIAGGVGCLIGFQTFINIGVVTGVLPNTGLPLPFVSYGLTSLVTLMIGIGFVLNVRLQTPQY